MSALSALSGLSGQRDEGSWSYVLGRAELVDVRHQEVEEKLGQAWDRVKRCVLARRGGATRAALSACLPDCLVACGCLMIRHSVRGLPACLPACLASRIADMLLETEVQIGYCMYLLVRGGSGTMRSRVLPFPLSQTPIPLILYYGLRRQVSKNPQPSQIQEAACLLETRMRLRRRSAIADDR